MMIIFLLPLFCTLRFYFAHSALCSCRFGKLSSLASFSTVHVHNWSVCVLDILSAPPSGPVGIISPSGGDRLLRFPVLHCQAFCFYVACVSAHCLYLIGDLSLIASSTIWQRALTYEIIAICCLCFCSVLSAHTYLVTCLWSLHLLCDSEHCPTKQLALTWLLPSILFFFTF